MRDPTQHAPDLTLPHSAQPMNAMQQLPNTTAHRHCAGQCV